MHILITGGAGFIGSNLSDFLLKKGHHITVVDNLTTGRIKNIKVLLSNPKFTFFKSDISSNNFLSKLNKFKFDQIYHLASPASVDYVVKNPISTAITASHGTFNVLRLANLHKIPVLFTSSSEAYGDPLKHPQKETYWGNVNPIGVRSGYDEGKRFGEALCMAFNREHQLDVKIVRIFNTYGPNSSMSDSRVIPQFIVSCLKGLDLKIYSDGNQTRSFCYIDDMVEGLFNTMNSDLTGPINLGGDKEVKIIDIAKKIIKLSNSSSKIAFQNPLPDDPKIRRPDLGLARKQINWKCKINLRDGLNNTINYFTNELSL